MPYHIISYYITVGDRPVADTSPAGGPAPPSAAAGAAAAFGEGRRPCGNNDN